MLPCPQGSGPVPGCPAREGGPPLADKPKSLLYKLEPLIKRFPAITKPEGHVHFRSKLLWSLTALIAYFFLANVPLYGLDQDLALDAFERFRAILAGSSGSLVHLGIGPIVTGSIIMQLFAGAKIINLDLTNDEDKGIYQGAQKILVIVMIFVEAVPQIFGFLEPDVVFEDILSPYGGVHSMVVGSLLLVIFGAIAVGISGAEKAGRGGGIFGAAVGGLGVLFAYLLAAAPLRALLGGAGAGLGGFVIALFVAGLLAAAGGAFIVMRRRMTGTASSASGTTTAFVGIGIGLLLALLLAAFANRDWSWGGSGTAGFWIVMQLAVGSYLVFLMDEVVSKWGLGSGISLFIAAGVADQVFRGLFNWLPVGPGAYSPQNPPAGFLPKTFYLLDTYSMSDLQGGGFEIIFFGNSNFAPNPAVSLIATVITFLVVVYVESSRVELPLAHGRVRGARGRYPIRLLYASNIPVILAGALLANVNLIGLLLWQSPGLSKLPFIGHQAWVGSYIPNSTNPASGLAYYFSSVAGVQDWLLPFLGDQYAIPYRANWQILVHLLVYAVFMIGGSILFAIFWIETTNMGPEKVAAQIQKSGMQIPGFRRDPRVTARILERYIPVVTVIGGAAVGGLAVFADLLGTLGQATGTGLLLAVGILQRLYEQIAKEQAMEMHPILRGFFGES